VTYVYSIVGDMLQMFHDCLHCQRVMTISPTSQMMQTMRTTKLQLNQRDVVELPNRASLIRTPLKTRAVC